MKDFSLYILQILICFIYNKAWMLLPGYSNKNDQIIYRTLIMYIEIISNIFFSYIKIVSQTSDQPQYWNSNVK